MQRFKNILVIYEGDRVSLDRAVALAQKNGARLTLVQPLGEMPQDAQEVKIGGKSIDLQKLATQELEVPLKKLIAPLEEKGVEISAKVLIGTPFLEIIREVINNKRDLVIKTAEGKGGLNSRLFGSTETHLMRKCPCPVWIMKSGPEKRIQRILASVEPGGSDKEKEHLSTTIMELATSLAKAESAELHIVHAWNLFGESLLRRRGRATNEQVSEILAEIRNRHEHHLNSFIKKFADGNEKVHLIKGEAATVIPEIAKKENIDLLVMGTVCRTGIQGFIIGNTAENVLNVIDCSVLTVKPKGFESPVTV